LRHLNLSEAIGFWSQLTPLSKKNAKTKFKIFYFLGSSDYIGDIANSELGYEDPDSVIIVPKPQK
jgi:hypothetical protein